jgi:ribosomal protein S18 acetylase RimI-like enzyme
VADTVTIRRADARDLPALGQLGAALMRVHYAFDDRRFIPPGEDPETGYAQFLDAQMASETVRVFVAERVVSGQPQGIAGYVYAAVEPRSFKELRDPAGFIHDLVVAGDAQRMGIGQQLLDAAVAWLREQGTPRVLLWTAAPNAQAQRLFASRGFRATMIEMTLELENVAGSKDPAS